MDKRIFDTGWDFEGNSAGIEKGAELGAEGSTKKLIGGAAAGVIGGLAMKAAVAFVDPNSFGLSSGTDAKTAHQVWARFGWGSLTEARAERIGAAMHYAFACGTGAAYAVAADRFTPLSAGRGSAFGAALWLVGDEAAVTMAGLEDARRTPLFSHLSALGAHVLYGVVVAMIVEQLQPGQ